MQCIITIITARQAIGRVSSYLRIMAVFKDSRDILIIHFGLLLKESILDSLGHALWQNIT